MPPSIYISHVEMLGQTPPLSLPLSLSLSLTHSAKYTRPPTNPWYFPQVLNIIILSIDDDDLDNEESLDLITNVIDVLGVTFSDENQKQTVRT